MPSGIHYKGEKMTEKLYDVESKYTGRLSITESATGSYYVWAGAGIILRLTEQEIKNINQDDLSSNARDYRMSLVKRTRSGSERVFHIKGKSRFIFKNPRFSEKKLAVTQKGDNFGKRAI